MSATAWLAVVCFADSLVRWFHLLCLMGAGSRRTQGVALDALAHPRTARARRARRRVVRILDGWPTAGLLLEPYQRIALIT
jgi:hypothetical protein